MIPSKIISKSSLENASFVKSASPTETPPDVIIKSAPRQFVVKFLINNRIKRTLINENAPDAIQKLYKKIAEIIIYSAIKNYAKGSGKCN